MPSLKFRKNRIYVDITEICLKNGEINHLEEKYWTLSHETHLGIDCSWSYTIEPHTVATPLHS